MPSIFDQNLLPEFDSIKDNDERILWTEKPKFIPFVLSGLWQGLFIILFLVVWVVFGTQLKSGDPGHSYYWQFWFGLIPVVLFIAGFIKKIISFPNTCYAYSDKRIMMRTGFIGTSFKIIDYDKISDIEVTVNMIERVFNVGTIKFYSGRTQTDDGTTTKLYDNWESIPNPYEVFRQVKEVMVDIKTDYNYPNALRPDSNPGYQTKYDRK